MPETNERVAVLEEANRQMVGRMDRLLGYMEKGEQWRNKAGEDIAIIKHTQQVFVAYQTKCDSDREELKDKVMNLDNFRKNTTRNASLVASFIAVGFTGLVEWFKK